MVERTAVHVCVWCRKNNQGACRLHEIGLRCQGGATPIQINRCITCHETRPDPSMPCEHCGEVAD